MKFTKSELVSVILPVYNADQFLEETISSVVSQDYKNIELIIINDASTDESENIVKSFDDERIVLVNMTINMGVATARNIGLARSNGKYIAFIDSDDLWNSDKISRQVNFMEMNKLDLCYSYYDRININKKFLSSVKKLPEKLNYAELLKSNSVPMLTAMVRKESIKNVVFQNEHHEDYLFWLQLVKQNDFLAMLLKENTAQYRVHGNSISGNKIVSLVWTWKIYRYEHISIVRSAKLMVSYLYRGIRKHI